MSLPEQAGTIKLTPSVIVKGNFVDGETKTEVPLKVKEDGTIVAEIQAEVQVDVGDVNIGTVKQGGKDSEAEPWEVQLNGSIIDLRGLLANRPAANAPAITPGVTTYWAVDDGWVYVSDGTNWHKTVEVGAWQ